MSSVFVEESTSSGTSARTWHAQVAAWLFRRKVGVMDVPTLKEANFLSFFKGSLYFFSGRGCSPGRDPRMAGTTHFQHTEFYMQPGAPRFALSLEIHDAGADCVNC